MAVYSADVNRIVPPGLNYGTQITSNPGGVVSIGYTHIFSSSLIGTLRYGHDYTNFGQYQTPAGQALANTINSQGIMPEKYGLVSVPAVAITGLTSTNQTVTTFGPQRQHSLSGNIEKQWGRHTIAVGFLASRVHSEDDGRSLTLSFDQYPTSSVSAAGVNATNTGNAVASMLLGLPSTIKGQVGSTNGDASGWQQGYYFDDTWRLTSRLTLHLGMRYDYHQPLTWHKPVSGFVPSCQCIELSQAFGPTYPTATAPPTWFYPQRNGFQPRFGVAYKLASNTVLRAGFAIFDDFNNDWIQQSLIERLSWPWGVGINLASLNRGVPTITFNDLPSAASLLPQPGQPALSPSYTWEALPTNKIPYSMLWNVGLEHQVANSVLLKATYVGSASRHLYIEDEFNAPLPNEMGPGAIAPRTPYPWLNQFQLDQNAGNASYNALELSVQGRVGAALMVSGAYTWSHCFSVQDAAQDFSNQNPYDRRPDYSSCDQDQKQTFVANYTYALPFGAGKAFGSGANGVVRNFISGWRTSGILTAATGLPFTVTVPVDNANIGQTAEVQRAQLVGNALPSGFRQTVNSWYNPAAFAVPAPYTFGNLGRNILRSPGLTNFDATLNKDFQVRERARLRFSVDFFNLPNHTELNAPGASVTTSTFLRIQSAKSARDIQFGLKLSF